ncbi:MAG: lactate racemase domain-containing protein [Chlamydiota bacterium]
MPGISLPYGSRSIAWDPGPLPVTVVRCNRVPALDDLDARLGEALRAPIASPPLRERLRECRRLAIVVSDATRLFPQGRILEAILGELGAIDPARVTIVVAGGNHGRSDHAAVGLTPRVTSRFRVVDHDSRDAGSMVDVGTLPPIASRFFLAQALRHLCRSLPAAHGHARKILRALRERDPGGARELIGYTMFGRALFIFGASAPSRVRVRREVADADLRILIGQVKPHFLAGFSGGYKAIFPGCADRTSIALNHFMMSHPSVALGRNDGNIIRARIEGAGRMCGGSFAVNVVMNVEGEVAGVFTGDPVEAQRRGSELSGRVGEVEAPAADLVVSAEGFPDAVNLYQLTKIVPPAAMVVRRGGAIVCAGECRDGVGGLSIVNDITFRIGFWRLLPAGVRVYLVSDIPKRDVEKTDFIHAATIAEAVDAERRRRSTPPSITVLAGSGLLIPRVCRSPAR